MAFDIKKNGKMNFKGKNFNSEFGLTTNGLRRKLRRFLGNLLTHDFTPLNLSLAPQFYKVRLKTYFNSHLAAFKFKVVVGKELLDRVLIGFEKQMVVELGLSKKAFACKLIPNLERRLTGYKSRREKFEIGIYSVGNSSKKLEEYSLFL